MSKNGRQPVSMVSELIVPLIAAGEQTGDDSDPAHPARDGFHYVLCGQWRRWGIPVGLFVGEPMWRAPGGHFARRLHFLIQVEQHRPTNALLEVRRHEPGCDPCSSGYRLPDLLRRAGHFNLDRIEPPSTIRP